MNSRVITVSSRLDVAGESGRPKMSQAETVLVSPIHGASVPFRPLHKKQGDWELRRSFFPSNWLWDRKTIEPFRGVVNYSLSRLTSFKDSSSKQSLTGQHIWVTLFSIDASTLPLTHPPPQAVVDGSASEPTKASKARWGEAAQNPSRP